MEGRERKLDGAAEKVGRICAHLSTCLPFYYERLLKLANSLQHKTIHSFLSILFESGLQSYLCVLTSMKRETLQRHKEVALVYEEGIFEVEAISNM